jgi:hypothetical protein
MTRVLVFALALVATTVRPSEACHKRHQSLFELYDLAESVAVVQVRSVSAGQDGQVELAVTRMIKGDAKKATLVTYKDTSCGPEFTVGYKALVLVDRGGRLQGLYEGYVRDVELWQPVIEHYAAARDDAARFASVWAAVAGPQREPSIDAAYYLVDRPELLARIDRDARAKLLELAKHPVGRGGVRDGIEDDLMFAFLLARLHDPQATALLQTDNHPWARAAVQLAGVTKFEAESDPNKLADAIAAGQGGKDVGRIAALERCERVRGKQLYPFSSYFAGVSDAFWKTLAESCRTGAPAHP